MVPAQNRPKIYKIVSVYSECTVSVQCVYSVCTLCAAKPLRHRPELPERLHLQKAAVQQIMH